MVIDSYPDDAVLGTLDGQAATAVVGDGDSPEIAFSSLWPMNGRNKWFKLSLGHLRICVIEFPLTSWQIGLFGLIVFVV